MMPHQTAAWLEFYSLDIPCDPYVASHHSTWKYQGTVQRCSIYHQQWINTGKTCKTETCCSSKVVFLWSSFLAYRSWELEDQVKLQATPLLLAHPWPNSTCKCTSSDHQRTTWQHHRIADPCAKHPVLGEQVHFKKETEVSEMGNAWACSLCTSSTVKACHCDIHDGYIYVI